MAAAADIRRVIFCCGKIYVDLASSELRTQHPEIALCRLEQLYPVPSRDLRSLVAQYERADEIVWVQEEPENMGAYHFLHGRLHSMLPKQIGFDHAAREESGAPATGSTTIHEAEQEDLLDAAFEGL